MKRFNDEELAGYLNPYLEAARAYERAVLGNSLSQGIEGAYQTYLGRLEGFLESFKTVGDVVPEPIPGHIGSVRGAIRRTEHRLAQAKSQARQLASV
jgi:hypothetical protein